MSITAMKQALEALEAYQYNGSVQLFDEAVTSLRQAIEQAKKQDVPEVGFGNMEPVAWMYDRAEYRENDLRGRRWAFNVFSQTKPYMDEMVRNVTPLYTTPPAALVQEPVAQAWAEGYRAGIADERTSEANIGIAGMGMKVEPARNNPYRTTTPRPQPAPVQEPVAKIVRNTAGQISIQTPEGNSFDMSKHIGAVFYTTPPAAQREFVGLTDEDIEQEFGFIDELLRDCVYRTETKLKEKNGL
jgi:hypothetical protein